MILETYCDKNSMPSNILRQILAMSNNASVYYHKFYTDAESSRCIMLSDIHSFFSDKNERIYTIQNKKGRDAIVHAYVSFFVDDSKIYHSCNVTTIHNIWVNECNRRSGLASKLVRRIFEDRKGSEFQISVYDRNIQAKKFWESVGFVNKFFSIYILNWEGEDNDND